jgi:hypothetical protein
MIDVSLNEVETMAAKAARGAGLDWGLSEDAGRSARWLAGYSLAWAPELLAVLSCHKADTLAFSLNDNTLASGASARLSPLLAGAYISDVGRYSDTMTLRDVASSLLLLPAAAALATPGCGVHVRCDDKWEAVLLTDATIMAGHACPSEPMTATVVLIAPCSPALAQRIGGTVQPKLARSQVHVSDWQALERLGAKTYVPATAQSRATGAGAGLSDND